ncbi:MAG TPA: DUF2235 domain-containing protein [Thermoanaerobaculia bacterium]|nr:DUF2235 domain-containing protein [Thermoanaerobaculia bacterium]
MGKKLVICCDGTWNRPDQETDEGLLCPTNVTKLAYRVAKTDGDRLQILFYDAGVGTGNVVDRYVGGALGEGLVENIFEAYRFLVANYQQGDEIYLFGFSRGAFTARSIAGMVRKCGVVKREHIERYRDAILNYQNAEIDPNSPETVAFRKNFAIAEETPIQCVGVFDTVGALGVPIGGRNREKNAFHDTQLSKSVRYAFHALAIDERRGPFEPTLWSYAPKPAQVVRQVWFAGVHSDIGGGYAEHELSDIALQWMIEQAKEAGLKFDDATMTRHPIAAAKADGTLHDSMSLKYRVLPKLDRPIGLAKHRDQDQAKDVGVTSTDDATQSIHPSVIARWDKVPKYRPPELRKYFVRVKDPRGTAP